jgi:myosin heavy subunit
VLTVILPCVCLLCTQGEWAWVPDEKDVYVAASVVGKADGAVQLRSQSGQTFNIRGGAGLEPLKLSSLQRIVNDLVLLDVMNNPLILHNLRARFERDDIYVRWVHAHPSIRACDGPRIVCYMR